MSGTTGDSPTPCKIRTVATTGDVGQELGPAPVLPVTTGHRGQWVGLGPRCDLRGSALPGPGGCPQTGQFEGRTRHQRTPAATGGSNPGPRSTVPQRTGRRVPTVTTEVAEGGTLCDQQTMSRCHMVCAWDTLHEIPGTGVLRVRPPSLLATCLVIYCVLLLHSS